MIIGYCSVFIMDQRQYVLESVEIVRQNVDLVCELDLRKTVWRNYLQIKYVPH